MEATPRWFLKELACIDPTYYVRVNYEAEMYDVMKEAEIYIKFRDGTIYKRKEPRVVGSYPHANYEALTSLRYRKFLGRQMRIIEKPGIELEKMRQEEAERMGKIKEEGFDMMSYGLKDGYEVDKRHTVS
jgi:hypothetical protein